MSYFDHPELPSAPAGEPVIWQYLSLDDFQKMMEDRVLQFARFDRLPSSLVDVESQVALAAVSGQPAELIRRSLSLMHSVQRAVFVNCWHENGSSEHRRWSEGGGEQPIAIRSSAKAIKAALVASSPTQKVYLSRVQYIDFDSTLMPTGNIFLPALHKQHVLRDEKEVRLLLLQTGGQEAFTPGPEQGVEVTVELSSLIDEVHVGSHASLWLRNIVRTLAEEHGMSFEGGPCTTASPSLGFNFKKMGDAAAIA
ncbi:hypothetical protein [Granulicella sp. L46]|uniref:hypothetical protein n=1 Tax=Granulicella sp. L46 TaxID=1641865 RepID=UPI00131E459C|nr:hypothetical protein [Granulicella sp. L46]